MMMMNISLDLFYIDLIIKIHSKIKKEEIRKKAKRIKILEIQKSKNE